jgi:hypothetical protein
MLNSAVVLQLVPKHVFNLTTLPSLSVVAQYYRSDVVALISPSLGTYRARWAHVSEDYCRNARLQCYETQMQRFSKVQYVSHSYNKVE